MNWAHTHLLLNHIPVLGTIFGLALLGYGIVRHNDGLKKVALGVFAVVALLALPAYFTGEPAEDVIERGSGVSEWMIDAHEEAALVALAGVELLGVIALGGLYLSRGGKSLSANVIRAAVVASLATAALMARTANLGGRIRHPEIGTSAPPPAPGHDADSRER